MLGHTKLDPTQIYTQVSIQKLKDIHTATHHAKNQLSKKLPSKPEAKHYKQIDKIRHWRIMQNMVIIETSVFTKLITSMMKDDEYRLLQESLIVKPDVGALIKGSGGLRKARWKLEGKGKSGGVRFIYYWVN